MDPNDRSKDIDKFLELASHKSQDTQNMVEAASTSEINPESSEFESKIFDMAQLVDSSQSVTSYRETYADFYQLVDEAQSVTGLPVLVIPTVEHFVKDENSESIEKPSKTMLKAQKESPRDEGLEKVFLSEIYRIASRPSGPLSTESETESKMLEVSHKNFQNFPSDIKPSTVSVTPLGSDSEIQKENFVRVDQEQSSASEASSLKVMKLQEESSNLHDDAIASKSLTPSRETPGKLRKTTEDLPSLGKPAKPTTAERSTRVCGCKLKKMLRESLRESIFEPKDVEAIKKVEVQLPQESVTVMSATVIETEKLPPSIQPTVEEIKKRRPTTPVFIRTNNIFLEAAKEITLASMETEDDGVTEYERRGANTYRV